MQSQANPTLDAPTEAALPAWPFDPTPTTNEAGQVVSVTLTQEQWQAVVEHIEDLEDIIAGLTAKLHMAQRGERPIPAEAVWAELASLEAAGELPG